MLLFILSILVVSTLDCCA